MSAHRRTSKIVKWWEPKIGKEELKLLRRVLNSNFPNEGPLTELFEKEIAGLLGAKYALATTSGTAALFLSLKALGIGAGDEVIVPDMTFIATANAVSLSGAKPVLADIDPQTMNICPKAVIRTVTKRTRAVIPVHVSGRAADMETLLKIARKHRFSVIEDAAEAFMSKHKGRFLGTFGKTGCFSFSPHKTITTGQGGMVVTDDEKLYVRLKELKDQGRPKRGTGGDDIHGSLGYNFKFTDLQAAVGLGQLKYLRPRLSQMKRNHLIYRERLSGLKGFSLLGFDVHGGEIPQWTDAIVEDRGSLDSYLAGRGIRCRRFWFPLHTQKPYKLSHRNFPSSTELSPKALWLPSAFTLSDADVAYACEHIAGFMKK